MAVGERGGGEREGGERGEGRERGGRERVEEANQRDHYNTRVFIVFMWLIIRIIYGIFHG